MESKQRSLRSKPKAGLGVLCVLALAVALTPLIPATAETAPNQVVGDFNGDGKSDLASYDSGTGTWTVATSSGTKFTETVWTTFTTKTGWGPTLVGDYNGDGKDDIANYHAASGNWWVSKSTGTTFTNKIWTTFTTKTGWGPTLVGDYNGDGKDDIANYHAASGNWWVSKSTGTTFTNKIWTTFTTKTGWGPTLVGDYNGDGKDDIANYHAASGNWWVSKSTGTTFTNKIWTTFTTKTGWGPTLVGDYNGDGKDDIANYHAASGNWWVSKSTGTTFTNKIWTTFTTKTGWGPTLVGDYNGDGKDDIANYHAASGNWWVSKSTGTTFTNKIWTTFTTKTGWGPTLVGDYNGDGKDDIANYHAASGNWWVSKSTGTTFTNAIWASTPPPPTTTTTAPPPPSVPFLDSGRSYDSSGYGLQSLETADVTGDGLTDIVAIAVDSTNVWQLLVYPYLGDRQFGAPQVIPLPTQVSTSIGIGDVNGDSLNDVVLCGQFALVFVQESNGVLNPSPSVVGASDPGWVWVGDLDGDDDDDVILHSLINREGTLVWEYEVILQSFDGQLSTDQFVPALSGIFWVGAADMTGDGRLDIVGYGGYYPATTSGWGPLVITNASVTGSFWGTAFVGSTMSPRLLFLERTPPQVQLATTENSSVTNLAIAYEPGDLDAADVNGDGINDLIVMHGYTDADLGILLGQPDGTFQDEQLHRLPITPTSNLFIVQGSSITDFDFDGHTDVAVFIATGAEFGVVWGK